MPFETVQRDAPNYLSTGNEQPVYDNERVQAQPERLGTGRPGRIQTNVRLAIMENVRIKINVRLPSSTATAHLLKVHRVPEPLFDPRPAGNLT